MSPYVLLILTQELRRCW